MSADTVTVKVDRSPRFRLVDGWSAPAKAPFIDTVTGLVYPSRSALKKAVRVRLNKDKPPRAIRDIGRPIDELPDPDTKGELISQTRHAIRAGVAEIMCEMRTYAREVVERRVAFAVNVEAVDAMVRQIVNQNIATAFGGVWDTDARRKAAIQKHIADVAKKEATKLITENLHLDFKIAGSGFTSPPGQRAVRLEEDPS